jgi:hypothetical protein
VGYARLFVVQAHASNSRQSSKSSKKKMQKPDAQRIKTVSNSFLLCALQLVSCLYGQPASGNASDYQISPHCAKIGILSRQESKSPSPPKTQVPFHDTNCDVTLKDNARFDKLRRSSDGTIQILVKRAKSGHIDKNLRNELAAFAEDLYQYGARIKDQSEKDSCALHYVQTSCAASDNLSDLQTARVQMIATNFLERRRYAEAACIQQQVLELANRARVLDTRRISAYNFSLGITYLAMRSPLKAQDRFNTCLRLDSQRKNDPMSDLHKKMIERFKSMVALQQGDIKRAQQQILDCVESHAHATSNVDVYSAGDLLWLARVLEKSDRIGESAVYYAKALHAFDMLAHRTGLRELDDSRATACEGLASVELRRDQPMIAHALRGKVARLRVAHSHWPRRLSDSDIEFYCLWQHLPNPSEPMTNLVDYNILDQS